MQSPTAKPETGQAPAKPAKTSYYQNSAQLLEMARADTATVLKELGSQQEVLSNSEALPV